MRAALMASDESDSRGGLFRAARDNNAQFVLNRRTTASALELHCFWDDILVIRSGLGVLRHGRKVKGLVRYGAGEWRASSLVGASEITLASHDVLRVPAGEAHSISPLGAAPLVYLVVKVRAFEERACGSLPKRGA
ncbi:MAG: cupin domain-containing protein [Gemmatimonadaceae bacterium]|nr:cupin domain-containing protein [Gemmatimonadaceae bacterium]